MIFIWLLFYITGLPEYIGGLSGEIVTGYIYIGSWSGDIVTGYNRYGSLCGEIVTKLW